MGLLYDGYQTLISLGGVTLIEEQTVTPPSIRGGGGVPTTTANNNVVWRTKKPKALLGTGSMETTVQYDPSVYGEIIAQSNVNQLIQIQFPDGTAFGFYGWLDDFSPQELEEGSLPLANLSIIASNLNGITEQGPVLF